MPLPPFIADAIEARDTVITSSARAARFLRRRHGELQRERGLAAWRSADILDWDSWLNRLWQKQIRCSGESRLLLTSLQEQQVWARLVRPSIEGLHLISVLSVSELAQTAYALLGAYDALDVLQGSSLGGGPDVDSFRTWALSFQQECRREAWLSRSVLPFALLEAVRAGHVEASERLVLAGFDRITPAQQRLIDALEKQGHSVEMADAAFGALAAPPVLIRAGETNDEIGTCALWLRHQLNALSSPAGIAVVVPNAGAVRSEIERTFRQVLAPETTLLADRDLPPPFEFSLGVPLALLPMVRAALHLLRWIDRGLLQDEASWLLLSGLICEHQAEQLAVARLDARLRQSIRQPEQELDAYLQFLDKTWPETATLGTLRRRLLAAQRLIPANGALNFAEWVQRAGQILDGVRWPGAHTLAGDDFQVQARWSQLLDGVAELAFDGRTVTYAAFLEVLEQSARQTIYAPESRDAPVQILGPFEAAGLTFDAMWFLGADDNSWPAAARPHPFLPHFVQRKYEMPHADSDVDFRLAQQVTDRLRHSAPQCVFSYAAQNDNGACRPSALVRSDAGPVSAAAFRQTIGANEDLADTHNSPATVPEFEPAIVVPWPAEKIAGGAEVLRNQAACPFRAFASRRLAAGSLEESDWGLDPRARGSLVHTVLDKLWAELVNRDGLMRARNEGRLPLLVGFQLDKALKRYRDDGVKRRWSTAYLAAEHERVLSIIEDWLQLEATRADFTVEAREDKRNATIGALKLQLRVDRVDQVTDGRVIIDYKTGVVRADGWDGPRPDDPQLPIYAGFCEVEAVKGVLLGRVADGQQEFIGRVENNNAIFYGQSTLIKPPYTEAMLQDWKQNLVTLADQFLRGEAQVDPKQYPKTCKYCDLPGLCRIAESDRGARDAGTDEGEGDAD